MKLFSNKLFTPKVFTPKLFGRAGLLVAAVIIRLRSCVTQVVNLVSRI